MKKIGILSLISSLAIFCPITPDYYPDAPKGDVKLMFNNGLNADLLIASTCSKKADEELETPKESKNNVLQLNFSGSPCKVIAIVKSDPTVQTVMCLDEYGCETNCSGNDPECAEGACDNFGVTWVRGCGPKGCAQYGKPGRNCQPGHDNCDVCIRSSADSIQYGITFREGSVTEIIERIFKGGKDIRFPLYAMLGADRAKEVLNTVGTGPAYDFANALWKFAKVESSLNQDAKNRARKAFCTFTAQNEKAKNLYYNSPGDSKWILGPNPEIPSFSELCKDQFNQLGLPVSLRPKPVSDIIPPVIQNIVDNAYDFPNLIWAFDKSGLFDGQKGEKTQLFCKAISKSDKMRNWFRDQWAREKPGSRNRWLISPWDKQKSEGLSFNYICPDLYNQWAW